MEPAFSISCFVNVGTAPQLKQKCRYHGLCDQAKALREEHYMMVRKRGEITSREAVNGGGQRRYLINAAVLVGQGTGDCEEFVHG
jgi:hypothetical protein